MERARVIQMLVGARGMSSALQASKHQFPDRGVRGLRKSDLWILREHHCDNAWTAVVFGLF